MIQNLQICAYRAFFQSVIVISTGSKNMFRSIIWCYRIHRRYFILLATLAIYFPFPASADVSCGSLSNGGNGPYDYNFPPEKKIQIVESAHFTPRVESLVGGNTSQGAGGDLAYTLMVFPNHPRALMAMSNLEFKGKTPNPVGARYSVPCWFDRALRFRPDDAQVHMIYGVYLLKKGKHSDAVTHLEKAASGVTENGNLHYNLGLAFFQLKDFEKSLQHAKKAQELGFDLPGLRNKLEKAGMWRE